MRSVVVGSSMNVEIPFTFSSRQQGNKLVTREGHRRILAGSTINVAAAVKKLCDSALQDSHIAVHVIGTVGGFGDDPDAMFAERELTNRGLAANLLPIREATPLTFSPIFRNGSVDQLLFCSKPAYIRDGTMVGGEAFEFVRYLNRVKRWMAEYDPRFTIVTGVQPIFEEISLAHVMFENSKGTKVLLPSESFIRERVDDFKILASRADILATNHVEAEAFLGERLTSENISRLHELGPKLILVTCNSKGAICSDMRDGEHIVTEEKAHMVPPGRVVDATGAGDNFLGAFITGQLLRWGISRCLKFACVSAALKVQRLGGSNAPSLNEIEKELLCAETAI